MAHVFHPLVFSPRIIESKLTCLRCFTNRIQPYGLSNRTEKQRKKFTVYSLRFQVLMLRIEPATPWQSPNKLGLCAWLKRSLQVMWFPLTSYILHHTSLGFTVWGRGSGDYPFISSIVRPVMEAICSVGIPVAFKERAMLILAARSPC